MKKEHLILAVIISAGIAGVAGFVAGTLLTRTDREKVKQQIEIIQKAADEKIQASNQLLNKAADNLNKSTIKLNESTDYILSLKKDVERWKDISKEGAEENDALTEKNENLQKFISNNSTDNIPGKFSFKNVQISRIDDMTVTVVGEVTNNYTRTYQNASFSVSLYDNKDQLLNVDSFQIGRIEKGQMKPFKVEFYRIFTRVSYCKFSIDSIYP